MTLSIAVIGYGEAGRAFGAGLARAGAAVAAYDVLIGSDAGRVIEEAAVADGVAPKRSNREAVDGADVVMSLVPANAARRVAETTAKALREGQVFIDMNSVSPREKTVGAAIVSGSGADYVEAAIMAPVATAGVATEVLMAGPHAGAACQTLAAHGMNVAVVGDRYGAAATVKLCRSVVIKGMEAILVESMLAARRFGADTAVLASLQKSDPEIDWTARADYVFERVLQHGRRRAAEMRFAGQAVADAGYPPLMSEAIAALQDSVADFAEADPAIRRAGGYAAAADLMAAKIAQQIGGRRDVGDEMAEEEEG